MNNVKSRIQNSLPLTLGTCVLLGVVLHFGNVLFLSLLSPVPIYIGMQLIDQSSQDLWLPTALLNFLFTAFCGFLITVVVLGILQFLLKPTSMLFSSITALPYIVLSYGWFIQDVSGFLQAVSIEQIWISLLSPLAAIGVWFFCSWWVTNKHSPKDAF